jgi:hypothetical protein
MHLSEGVADRRIDEPEVQAPPEPEVRVDVEVELVREVGDIGVISSMSLHSDPEDQSPSILAMGRRGCVWLSIPDLAVKREVQFAQVGAAFGPDAPLAAVDLDGDGVPEALEKAGDYDLRSLTARSTITGEVIWTFQPHSPIILMAPLRKREGGMVIMVGCRRSAVPGEGFDNHIQILDAGGKLVEGQRWTERDGAFVEHVFQVVDHDRDGADELLYGSDGEIILRDASGAVLWRERPIPQSAWTQAIFPLLAFPRRADGAEVFFVRITASRLFRSNSPAFRLRLTHEDGRPRAAWREWSEVEAMRAYRAGTGYVVPLPGAAKRDGILHIAYRENPEDAVVARVSTRGGQPLLDKKLKLTGGRPWTGCPTLWSSEHGAYWFAWGTKIYSARLVPGAEGEVVPKGE